MTTKDSDLTAAMRVLDVRGTSLDVAVFALRLIEQYMPHRQPCTSRGQYRRGDGPVVIARTALRIIEARGYWKP